MSDWRDRSSEFVDVREYDDGRPIVIMDLVPPDADVMHDAWDALTSLWLELPPHANILDAVERSGPLGLMVRFAAIDWRRNRLSVDEGYATLVAAAWGLQLCYAMSCIAYNVDADERGPFTCPLVKVDIDDQVRLAFLPCAPRHPVIGRFVAPEVRRDWPRCHEPGLVYVVGVALRELLDAKSTEESALAPIIARCCEEQLRDRYATIQDVRVALRAVTGVKHALRQQSELDEWRAIEEGIGWQVVRKRPTARDRLRSHGPPSPGRELFEQGKTLFAAGRLDDARAAFERALALDPMLIEAMNMRREVDRLASRTRAEAGHAWAVNRDLADALEKSARLEAALERLDADEGDSAPLDGQGKMPSGT